MTILNLQKEKFGTRLEEELGHMHRSENHVECTNYYFDILPHVARKYLMVLRMGLMHKIAILPFG